MASVQTIQEMIQPSVEGLGYELWGLELVNHGKYSTLRLYIEAAQGITVDDCAKVSHQVSGILDVEDPISTNYNLEVSSPGLDRPLFTKSQFEAYVGQFVRVRLHVPFEGRRKFAGVLTAVEGDDIVVLVDQEEYLLPIDSVDKANIDSTVKVKEKFKF